MIKEVKRYFNDGPVLMDTAVFNDDRGYFMETFNLKELKDIIGDIDFVQQNISKSKKNVLRGLHYQKAPHEQAKLVRVIKGSGFDVAVDIRLGSDTFGQWCGVYLSESNSRLFYIPKGFAHGFLALEDDTLLNYNCSDYYHKECEASINYLDSDININWGEWINPMSANMSEKDLKGVLLCDAEF